MTIKADELAPADPTGSAFNAEEYDFLERLHRITVWLSHERPKAVLSRCMTELDMTESEAHEWILKAKEYLAMGAVEHRDRSRDLYLAKVRHIYAKAADRIVADEIEITTKPMRVRVEGGAENGKMITIDGKTTKVKPRAFNAGAASAALKAAKEEAIVLGVRGSEGNQAAGAVGGHTSPILIQVNSGAPVHVNAQNCQDMTNEVLAKLLESGPSYEVIDAGVPGQAEPIAEGEHSANGEEDLGEDAQASSDRTT